MARAWVTSATRLCTLVAAVALLDGCAFWGLRKDVSRLDAMGVVTGHVARPANDDAPIVVVLATGTPAQVTDSFVLDPSGAYFFVVPAGAYQIAAFLDRNRDFSYEPNEEPAAYYGGPTDVHVAPGQKVRAIDVQLPSAPEARLAFSVAIREAGRRGNRELPPVEIGEVVTLDDPRFAPENAKRGMWQPVEFMFDVGAGFYFLQEFDPKKTPVLFVHGAGGTPRDWKYLTEHLDRTKFQPWVLYYPTGLDLDLLARGAARWMNTLMARYAFEKFIMVAHSMGGLVSRATINQMTENGTSDNLALFITLSTPWNGYGAAAAGAEHSPVVMPMWTDMAPGSPFLESIFRTPLPPQCPYYLLFSYAGHSLLADQANDGVVTLSSELALSAQHAAKKVYGFDESHDGILESPQVSQTLNALLAEP